MNKIRHRNASITYVYTTYVYVYRTCMWYIDLSDFIRINLEVRKVHVKIRLSY